jgi:hypothetical protein
MNPAEHKYKVMKAKSEKVLSAVQRGILKLPNPRAG